MWVKLSDRLPEDPRLIEAARTLGDQGMGRALVIFSVGLCAASRANDPIVSDDTVRTWTKLDECPLAVMTALAASAMVTRVPGGFRFPGATS